MVVLKSLAARASVMLIAMLCTVFSVRIIVSSGGVSAYAFYSLVTALPGLVSAPDLGAGAALVNSVAKERVSDDREQSLLVAVSVLRILGFTSCLLVVAAFGLSFFEGWEILLGSTSSVEHAGSIAGVTCVLFALWVPLSLPQRVLMGLSLNHLVILVNGLQAPFTLAGILVLRVMGLGAGSGLWVVPFFAAMLIVGLLLLAVEERRSDGLLLEALLLAFHFRSVRGAKVMNVGGPNLVQGTLVPFSTQLDRVVLGRVSGVESVAVYGLAAQFFFSLQSLFSAAGLALWPEYLRKDAEGVRTRSLLHSLLFGLLAGISGALLCLVSPWLFRLVSDGMILVPTSVCIAFSLAVTMQAVLIPLGMRLMDERGLKFQIIPVLLMVVLNLLLTFVLSRSVGASGPALATFVSVGLCQVVPYSLEVRRRFGRLGSGSQ